MCTRRIRFVQRDEGITIGIRFPTYAFKVLWELFAVPVDEEPALAGLIPQPGVHAVHPIFHRWVCGRHVEADLKSIAVTPKE
jgi:hypothetical protein